MSKRKPKYDSEYYLEKMYMSLNAEYVDIADYDISAQNQPSPESEVIKKELYQNLSQESVEVIKMIIDSPAEILEMISTPKGVITEKLVKKYLLRKWTSTFVVESVIKEIKNLVRSL
jgi:hypothetical protein